MGRRFFIETFGCQMNELDSERIAGQLRYGGLQPACSAAEADLIILNTCSIRDKAVQKVYSRLGELRSRKAREPGLMLGVVGCMAQLEGDRILKKAPFVDLIAGPQKACAIEGLLAQRLSSGRPAADLRMEEDTEPAESSEILRESRWHAGVTISEGCDRRCSFCVIPYTRGRQRDRSSARIVREIEGLVAQGCLEVTLLGQTVTSYRDPSEKHPRFARLLRRLAKIDGLERIRFTAPHPNDFDDDLLVAMAELPQVCDHIHLPVQSGSTTILRAMRRGYSREHYLDVVRKIKSAPRLMAISTDIIVGFPGETDKDFEDTLSLLDTVQYDGVFSFKYSPRPSTPAFGRGDEEVPEEKKRERLRILLERQRLIQYNKNAGYLGRNLQVLVDGKARTGFSLAGRASNNRIVNFDGPEELVGTIVPVEITGFGPNSLKGAWNRQRLETTS